MTLAVWSLTIPFANCAWWIVSVCSWVRALCGHTHTHYHVNALRADGSIFLTMITLVLSFNNFRSLFDCSGSIWLGSAPRGSIQFGLFAFQLRNTFVRISFSVTYSLFISIYLVRFVKTCSFPIQIGIKINVFTFAKHCVNIRVDGGPKEKWSDGRVWERERAHGTLRSEYVLCIFMGEKLIGYCRQL